MNIKRLVNAVLVVICVFSLLVPASATEMRASDRIASCVGTLSRDSNGVLKASYTTWATDTMEQVGASKIAIQWQVGSRWITEYTFTLEDTPALVGKNCSIYSGTASYVPYHASSKYRAVIDFYAQDNSGESTIQRETNKV